MTLFLLACAGSAALLWAAFGPAYAALGPLALALARIAIDLWRLRRIARALRADAAGSLPRGGGQWGEVVQRFTKLLRERDANLRQSEARLQEFLVALESSPNGVVLLDEQARIEWCNQTAASHFGFDAGRDRQQYIGNLVRDPSFAAYLASWNYSRDLVLGAPVPGGPVRKLSVQAHPYAGNRRLLLSRDVTAVEQAEAMRRDFIANVSHEIRTPLTVLAGFVETLQTLPLEADERSHYLNLMAQQSQRMQTLVSDLLTLSKLEGSPPPGAGEWMPLEVLARQCAQEARSLSAVLSPQRRHDLVLSPGPALEISGAAAEFQSALGNLMSNAVRYTPPGGRIEVSWRSAPAGGVEISVRDAGPGIAPEHIPRLTERFYRVDRSRSRETGGTGLGLAIVKHVVQRHGGELRIDSVPGEGSVFTIQLPASRVRPLAPPAGTSERPATESAAG